jgi:hypothetical protein
MDMLRACLFNSFAAGTAVLLDDGSSKPIEEIQRGDSVRATDPISGVTEGRRVSELHRNVDTELTDVTLRGGAVISTTQHHPFWNATAGHWAYAAALKPGVVLRAPEGTPATVADVQSFDGVRTMYNLTVDGLNTYYVVAGGTPVLVHNTGPCDLPPLGLGTAGGGTKRWAEDLKFTHHMDDPPELWRGPVKTAIDEGVVDIHFNLRSMNGGPTVEGRLKWAINDGLGPGPYATSEELTWIGRAIYHKKRTWDSVTFHDENGVVDKASIKEPDWGKILPDSFLNNDLWLKKNGLRSWDD